MKYQQRRVKHNDNFSLISFHAMLSLLILMALLASQVGDLSLHLIHPGSISCPPQAYHERIVKCFAQLPTQWGNLAFPFSEPSLVFLPGFFSCSYTLLKVIFVVVATDIKEKRSLFCIVLTIIHLGHHHS